jgi:hypothetical protein
MEQNTIIPFSDFLYAGYIKKIIMQAIITDGKYQLKQLKLLIKSIKTY